MYLFESLSIFSIFCFHDTSKSSGIVFFSIITLHGTNQVYNFWYNSLFLSKRAQCHPCWHFQIVPSYSLCWKSVVLLVSWLTIVMSDPKAPFSIATTMRCRGGCYSFPWIASLILNLYLIMLSVKQGGINHHFLSLWYDSTWDWTLVSRTIGEQSNHYANGAVKFVVKGELNLSIQWRKYLTV